MSLHTLSETTVDHWQSQEAGGLEARLARAVPGWARLHARSTWLVRRMERSQALQFAVGTGLGFVLGAVLLLLALFSGAVPLSP